MTNELEQKLDVEFRKKGICPNIYHFRERVLPFKAITIVTSELSWQKTRWLLDALAIRWRSNFDSEGRFFRPYDYFSDYCHKRNIYGVGFHGHAFHRQRGRIIAKGRLLKHLKEIVK